MRLGVVQRLKLNPRYELNISLHSMRIIEDALIELHDAIQDIEIGPGSSDFTASEIINLKNVSSAWPSFKWVESISYNPSTRNIGYAVKTPYSNVVTNYNVNLPLATTAIAGLMSAADKLKLDNLTDIDFSNYYTKDEVDYIIANLDINFITIEI